jgi:hypothetical protein
MSSEFKVEINTMTIPNLEGLKNMDIPLTDNANKMVSDIKRNIRIGLRYYGTRYPGLAEKTIRDKRGLFRTTRKGKGKGRKRVRGSVFPRRALYRTGELFRGIRYRKISGLHYQVYISGMGMPRRSILAGYHQNEGVNQYTRIRREFFGVSQKRWKLSIKRIDKHIANVINKAYLKTVREIRRF